MLQQLRPKVDEKDLLIVIDDVWSVDHAWPFLAAGPARLCPPDDPGIERGRRSSSFRRTQPADRTRSPDAP